MTLELRLLQVSGSPEPRYIYVDGGQSGALRLQLNKLPQTIRCSKKDHLTFILCGKKSKLEPVQDDIIARRDFWAEATIDQNRQRWDDQQEHQYQLQYFDTKHEKAGQLSFQVKFIRGFLYQGQITATDKRASKLMPFYKGQCPTMNLYNCLDPRDQPSKFNIIEHVYKDQ